MLRHPLNRFASILIASFLALIGHATEARASNLSLPSGGRVSIELLTSDAAFHNTLSIASPNVALAFSGCRLEPADGLPGQRLMSEKNSQHGCRVDIDADPATPGIQSFAPGAVLTFNMCAQQNADPACENVWSSDPAQNGDSFDHVRTTALASTDYPGRIFQIAWEDQAGGGDQDFNDLIAIVRADMDSDGDGLWDDWERFGADTDGDGAIDLDLPALGANPNHKDIFIEIDWMDCALSGSDCASGDTHSHRPKDAAITTAIAAFAAAPVSNPDGTTGINLHIDRSNSIPHQQAFNINGLCFGGGAGIGSFDAVKADPANFGPLNPRRFAYHYSVWTHQQVTTSTSSGCGELPGNDFQVALGGWNSGSGDVDGDGLADGDVGTIAQQAGTLLHELGHNLNLQHGGADGVNFKPNFISAMNYWFQVAGIPPNDPDGVGGPLIGRVDYSRQTLATLVETNLTESTGAGLGTDNSFYFCPNWSSSSAVGSNAVDWNCNTLANDVSVSNDVNGDRACVGAGDNGVLNTTPAGDDFVQNGVIVDGPDRTCSSAAAGDDGQFRGVGDVQIANLTGFADWTNIFYDLQSTGSFDDGYHAASARVTEIDFPTYRAVISPDLQVTATVAPMSVVSGTALVYSVSVRNLQPHAASGVHMTQTLPANAAFSSCAADHGGVCGGAGATRTVDFSVIPGGESALVTIQAAVPCAVADGTAGTSTINVTTTTAEPNLTNNQASVSFVTVNPPPTISSVVPSIASLWPPNHRMVPVTIAYDTSDNCGTPSCSLSVTSNEPIDGTGDGDTTPDWTIVDSHVVNLRAERAGSGNGRQYSVKVTCVDSAGGSSSSSTTVIVPKNR